MADPRVLPDLLASLSLREQQVLAAEVELSIAEGQARTREAEVQTRFQVLRDWVQGLDARARQAHETSLVGAQADLDADVQASQAGRLQQGRQTLVHAHEEWIARRRRWLGERVAEFEAVEAGLIRTQQRIDARERRLLEVAPHPPARPQAGQVAAPGASSMPAGAQSLAAHGSTPAQGAGQSGKASTHQGIGVGVPGAARMAGHISTQPLGTRSAAHENQTSRVPGAPAMKPVDMTQDAVRSAPVPLEDPRHAPTLSMDPDEPEALDAQVHARQTTASSRERARTTHVAAKVPPPADGPLPAGLPDDLPDSVPDRLARRSPPTSPFVPGLKLGGEALVRAQLQVDRANHLVLVSFRRGTPHLEPTPVLAFQAPGGPPTCFATELRRIVPAPEGGAVVILSTAAWDVARSEAFDRALHGLP